MKFTLARAKMTSMSTGVGHDGLGDVIVTVLSGPEFLIGEAFSDLESLTVTGLSDLKDEARLIFPRPTASDDPARQ
jgi:hypothetical protein